MLFITLTELKEKIIVAEKAFVESQHQFMIKNRKLGIKRISQHDLMFMKNPLFLSGENLKAFLIKLRRQG